MKYLILLPLLTICLPARAQHAKKKVAVVKDSVANVKVFFVVDEEGKKDQVKVVSIKCICDSLTKVQAVADAYRYVYNLDIPGVKDGQPYTLPVKIHLNR